MGLRITTDDKPVKVYKKEKQWSGGVFYTYSLAVASKDSDGNWLNSYIDCTFKKTDADKITNKCKIKINNAFPTVTNYQNKNYVKWMILDFEVVEQGETAADPNAMVNLDSFMEIDDSVSSEVPFL